ncbi:MAG: hypothetical protein AAGG02_02765, partial [Cyanobacteria bacterium P01_H01_bin.15]
DIYGQVIVWLMVIFVSLAAGLALWTSSSQMVALAMVGMIIVLSLPFLLFAFVTTLFNHIEFTPVPEKAPSKTAASSRQARQQLA